MEDLTRASYRALCHPDEGRIPFQNNPDKSSAGALGLQSKALKKPGNEKQTNPLP
jgi:hypothetical protein